MPLNVATFYNTNENNRIFLIVLLMQIVFTVGHWIRIVARKLVRLFHDSRENGFLLTATDKYDEILIKLRGQEL